MSTLTDIERAIMWSALGWKEPNVDPQFKPYRNRYYTNETAPAADTWRELVTRGLAFEDMEKEERDQRTGTVRRKSLAMFWVSALGLDMLGVSAERRGGLEGYERGETSDLRATESTVMTQYIEVAYGTAGEGKAFAYANTQDAVNVGDHVLVPVGKNNVTTHGVVRTILSETPKYQCKEMIGLAPAKEEHANVQ